MMMECKSPPDALSGGDLHQGCAVRYATCSALASSSSLR